MHRRRKTVSVAALALAVSAIAIFGLVATPGSAQWYEDMTVVDDEGNEVSLVGCNSSATPGADLDPETSPDPDAATPLPEATPRYAIDFMLKGSPSDGDALNPYLGLYSAILTPGYTIPMECVDGYFLIYVERGTLLLTVGPEPTGLVKVSSSPQRAMVEVAPGEWCGFDCVLTSGQSVELIQGDAIFLQYARISFTNNSVNAAATLLVASYGIEDLPCGAGFC